MSQAMRKLTAAIARTDCLVVFINQIREKIGVMFGSPETTTGGRALKFYASVRLDIRRIGQVKEGEETIGSRTKVTVVKNKIAPPFRRAEFDILYSEGISRTGDLIDIATEQGVILKSGTWLSYKHPKEGEIRLGQGREKARALLGENADLAKEIERALLAKSNAARGVAAAPGTSGATASGNGAPSASAPGTPPSSAPAAGARPPAKPNELKPATPVR
jgi:recombination protein RecA